MINIHDGQITDLLSNTLRYNPETIAISYAVLQEKRRILDLVERTRLMSAVDILDERILDYLAVELRTPTYDDGFPIGIKRKLIAGTLAFYAKLGTPAAINWIIQAIFGEGQMEDWYRYGGTPHHFRIQSRAPIIATDGVAEFLRALESVKRLSSWLDEIILEITGPPFAETPGHLLFHRFKPSWAFSHFRGGIRFNGDADFGGDIRFDQAPPGIGFPHFTVSTHFVNIKGGTPFDGTADFGGSLIFDQAYSSVKLPTMRISAAIGSHRERLTATTNDRITFSNRRGGLRFDGIPSFLE